MYIKDWQQKGWMQLRLSIVCKINNNYLHVYECNITGFLLGLYFGKILFSWTFIWCYWSSAKISSDENFILIKFYHYFTVRAHVTFLLNPMVWNYTFIVVSGDIMCIKPYGLQQLARIYLAIERQITLLTTIRLLW